MIILEVQDICKYYGAGKKRHIGCEHISFTAEAGGIYSLLGLNGAGKSTVLNSISGYRLPSSGDVSICGYSILTEPIEAKRHIGILYEQNPLYDTMTVREFLLFTLQMRGFGSAVLEALNGMGYKGRIHILGIPDRFIGHGTVAQLQALCGYSGEEIAKRVENDMRCEKAE